MSDITVWGRPTSTRTLRVLWTLAEIGLDIDLVLASGTMGAGGSIQNGNQPYGIVDTPDYRAMNPMGEVPVLEHRGEVLTQSGAILDYLAEALGTFRPAPGQAREVLRWILWDNHKLTAKLATWRWMANYLDPEKRNPDIIAFLEGRARTALKVLDQHLQGRDWIVGTTPTIADLSCAGYMFYAEEYPIDWQGDFPAVSAWTARIAALPRWKHPYDLMPGHPVPGR